MGNSRNNNYSNTRKKSTGAKLHSRYGSENGVFITAWNKGKKAKIFRSEKQSEIAPTVSQSGKDWVSVTIVVQERFKNNVVVSGLLDASNHKVYIREWNMIVNPSAPNGGYWGQHIRKNYDN